jgi:hypothetical protein
VSRDSVREQLRRMVEENAPELVDTFKRQIETDRRDVNEWADDTVLLMVRDVRKHWESGECDGDRMCLGGAFSSWAADASEGEMSLILGRAIALLCDVLATGAGFEASVTAAEARDERREREGDAVPERVRDSVGDDTPAALVLRVPHGETPDLGAILRSMVGRS